MTNATFRPTVLDALTTMEVTSELLLIRADYWDNVAVRHVRNGRDAQAERLFKNVAAMRSEARRLARLEKAEPFTTDRTRAALASVVAGKAAARVAKITASIPAPVAAPAKAKPAKVVAKPAPARQPVKADSFAEFRARRAA